VYAGKSNTRAELSYRIMDAPWPVRNKKKTLLLCLLLHFYERPKCAYIIREVM